MNKIKEGSAVKHIGPKDVQHDNEIGNETVYDPFNQEEFGDEIWIGTKAECKKAWTKYRPECYEDTIETLIEEDPKLTKSSTNTEISHKLMKIRDYIQINHLKKLLLEASISHMKIISFLHYGPGQKKFHMKADF